MLPDNEIGIATLNSVSTIFKHNIFFFLVLSDLNQAVPNHLADESQTR